MKNRAYFFIAGSFFLIFFILLVYIVYDRPDALTSPDSSITAVIRKPYPKLNSFFIWYTQLANSKILSILTIFIIIIFLRKKWLIEAIWLAINVGGIAGIVNYMLKHFFMRQRPLLDHLVTEKSYSFPSGHSIGSMLFYGTLILLLPKFLKQTKLRITLQFILGIAIILIGASRIYLGVHYPSDILGGFSLGLAWLLLTYPLYVRYQSKNSTLLTYIEKYYFNKN